MRAFFLLILALSLLATCSDVTAEKIRKKYTNQVRLLDIVPVYPPREDVQVGDLRLEYAYPDDDDGRVFEDLDRIPAVIRLAEQKLADRTLFDDTTFEKDGKIAPTSSGISLGTTGRVPTRLQSGRYPLPLVALPKVTVRATNSFNAGLLTPLQALGLLVGNSSDVTLDFNDTRVFGVTRTQASQVGKSAICNFLKSPLFKVVIADLETRATAYDNANNIPEKERAKRVWRMNVVTKVYLTRQISYTYNNAQIRAAALQALKDGKAPAGTVPVPQVINITGSVTADAVPSFASTPAATSLPANSVSFGSLTSLGVSINRSFERPVVVGYEGANINVDDAVPDEMPNVLAPPATVLEECATPGLIIATTPATNDRIRSDNLQVN